MIGKKLVFLPLIFAITVTVAQVLYQGAETNQNKQPTKHNRQPIESDKCLEGEFLYPGDNEKDWVCDCKPIHVYHPETLKCYQVFTQGPCKKGEMLSLLPKKPLPKCIRNPCQGTKVSYRGRCVNLGENGGCPPHLVVQVNSTSLQLTCGINFDTRFGEENDQEDQPLVQHATPLNITDVPSDAIGAACLFGGKRSQAEECSASA